MTNDALCALLLQEPQQGFTALIGEYGGYVYTIVRSKLADVGTTQDVEETSVMCLCSSGNGCKSIPMQKSICGCCLLLW